MLHCCFLSITHASPPAVLYLLIKADRRINQRLGASAWPHRSNPRRVSCSASPLLRDDWQLSCPHHCRLIFVRSHLSDRGSVGLFSQETAHSTAASVLRGFTYRRATPVIGPCRWNYVWIISCYIFVKSKHNIHLEVSIFFATIMLFILPFDHVVTADAR